MSEQRHVGLSATLVVLFAIWIYDCVCLCAKVDRYKICLVYFMLYTYMYLLYRYLYTW